MISNINSLFKKVCSVGLIAIMSLCGSTSYSFPDNSIKGVLVRDAGYAVTKGIISNFNDLYTISLNGDSSFNGSPKQIISSITRKDAAAGTTLYLRVVNNKDGMPTNESPWVKYENADSLKNNALLRKDVGTYYVYVCIEGGNNYNNFPISQNELSIPAGQTLKVETDAVVRIGDGRSWLLPAGQKVIVDKPITVRWNNSESKSGWLLPDGTNVTVLPWIEALGQNASGTTSGQTLVSLA